MEKKIKQIKSHVLISVSFWFILLLFSIFCGTVYFKIVQINNKLTEITKIAYPTVESSDNLIITLHESSSLARSSVNCRSIYELKKIEKRTNEIIRINHEAVVKLGDLANQYPSKYPTLKTMLEEAEKEFKAYLKIVKQIFNAQRNKLAGKSKEDNSTLLDELNNKVNLAINLLNKITFHANQELKKTDAEATNAINTAMISIVILFLIAALTGLLITYFITRTISKAEKEKDDAFNEIDQIFNSAPVGMWLVNNNLEISKVNNTFLEMTATEEKEILGRKANDIWNKFGVEIDEEAYDRILTGKSDYVYEKKISVDKKKKIICSITALPFFSNKGKIIGILENFIDITERKLAEKEIMLAISTERQRMGQNLHDSIGQKLTGLSYLNQAIKTSLRDHSYNAANDINQSISIIAEIIDQTRLLSKNLYPVNFEKFGFASALRELSIETGQLFNISCEVRIQDDLSVIDTDVQINLYYIAKESIHNSIKHGKASKITMNLTEDSDYIILEIVDDGKKDKTRKKSNNRLSADGIGMRIMKYRAGLIGARFNAAENNAGGFTVSVRYRKQ